MEKGPYSLNLSTVKAHEIHDEYDVNTFVALIDELAYSLDMRLLEALADNLTLLRNEYLTINAPEQKSAWFKKTFSFLYNHSGNLSPRLFTYFQQSELLILKSQIFWFDELSPLDKERVGDKLFEIINKPDTPRRADFFTMLPYHIMMQGAKVEISKLAIPKSCKDQSATSIKSTNATKNSS